MKTVHIKNFPTINLFLSIRGFTKVLFPIRINSGLKKKKRPLFQINTCQTYNLQNYKINCFKLVCLPQFVTVAIAKEHKFPAGPLVPELSIHADLGVGGKKTWGDKAAAGASAALNQGESAAWPTSLSYKTSCCFPYTSQSPKMSNMLDKKEDSTKLSPAQSD